MAGSYFTSGLLPPPAAMFAVKPKSALEDRNDAIADKSTLTWLNALLGWIWPKANTALSQYAHEDLTQRLQESLPAPFKRAHFSRFTLGNNTPVFGPIEVIRHSDSAVEVDLEMRYNSNVDICLDAGTGGIVLGINQLTFKGRLCLVLDPLMDKWPIVGSTKLFFSSLPQITLRFTGLASVAHYPGIELMVQSTVDDWFRCRFVLPNRSFWCYLKQEDTLDLMTMSSMQPLGVLSVRIIRAKHLAGVNWKIMDVDHFTSDPYCELRLGSRQSRTSTIFGSTDPEWPPNEPASFFIVHHPDQLLEGKVLGEDRGGLLSRNFTAFLGEIPRRLSVWEILTSWPEVPGQSGARRQWIALDTTRVNKDLLHVNDTVNAGVASELEIEALWLDLLPETPLPSSLDRWSMSPEYGLPTALLEIELRKGNGFPVEYCLDRHGLRWRSRIIEPGGFAQSVDTPALSRRGTLSDVEQLQFPELPIHPQLFPVIDKLLARGFSITETARIVGVDQPDVIILYLQKREEFEQQHQELNRKHIDGGQRHSVQWFEALSHLLRGVPEDSSFLLELLVGEDQVVGQVGPLHLQQVLQQRRRSTRQIELASASEPLLCRLSPSSSVSPAPAPTVGGMFAAWFGGTTPLQAPTVVSERFREVDLLVSVRLFPLAATGIIPSSPGRESAVEASARAAARHSSFDERPGNNSPTLQAANLPRPSNTGIDPIPQYNKS